MIFREFEDHESPPEMTAEQYKMAILEALKQLHGEVGKATMVDILKYDDKSHSAIIRIPSR